ncbi:hypothetical protein AJ87_48070 [Rhizobium yanglingense]|nr:hypothetical protein AJ87_48070 [Rhizobium yanglingense]
MFAETLEQATAAAALIKVSYDEKQAIFGFDDPRAGEGIAVEQMTIEWGNAEQALAEAPVRIEAEYKTPREYNVPIEPHGLIAKWDGDV